MLVKKTIDSTQIATAIEAMADAIAQAHARTENLVLAGIANGGVPLCSLLERALARRLGRPIPKAIIDISFHRDDIHHKPITKEVQATHMAHDPENATIVMVDDVIFSGRTARAAIAEILTIGRPYKVELAALVDRGNRRLPLAPDYVGLHLETTTNEKVRVHLDPNNPSAARIELLQP